MVKFLKNYGMFQRSNRVGYDVFTEVEYAIDL